MKAYFIHCSTGCTCCASQNHIRGPLPSLASAQKWAKRFSETRLLSSQYAENGRYEISEHEAEILSTGRIIIGDRVFPEMADEDSYPEEIYSDFPSGTWIGE